MQQIRSPSRGRRSGRRKFLAVEQEVRRALAAGFTVTDMYESLSDRVEMSYSQFARYVQALRAQRAAAPPGRSLEAPRVIGTPETVPSLNMDSYAAKSLKSDDLI